MAAPQLYAAHTQATARSRRWRVERRPSLLLKSSWWLPARRKRDGAGLGIGIARMMHKNSLCGEESIELQRVSNTGQEGHDTSVKAQLPAGASGGYGETFNRSVDSC